MKEAYAKAEQNQDPEKLKALLIAIKKHRLTVEKLRGGYHPRRCRSRDRRWARPSEMSDNSMTAFCLQSLLH